MMFLVLKDSIELGLFLSLVSSGPSQYPPSRSNSRGLNESGSQAQINPSVIIIIVVLSVVFFLSGCLHLLVRCLVRNPRRDPNNIVSLTAVQGQLQQLFLLHDSGVEQAFIDTLPVFFYKSVSGLKEGADCAVCLNEFQGEDRLRLLPKCSHAFHLECIDTWLLSHSTCPLCRSSLLSDGLNLPPAGPALLLDSNGSIADGVDHVEAVQNDDEVGARRLHGQYGVVCSSLQERHLDGSCATAAPFDPPLGHAIVQRVKGDMSTECNKLERQEEPASVETGGRVVPVLLGRFRILEDSGYGASSSASRRSYSVGSYEYVMDPSNLEVVIAPTPCRRRTSTPRRVTPGHRTTLSECTPEDVTPDPVATPFGDSLFERRLSPLGEGNSSYVAVDIDSIAANLASTRESATKEEDTRESATKEEVKSTSKSIKLNAEGASKMSISKQELQSNNCIPPVERLPSRRAFSFRLPLVDAKLKISASRRSLSESDVAGWDEEDPSVSYAYPTGFAARAPTGVQADVGTSMPSIARRTINWLVGRQKRIVHASSGAPR